MIKSVVEFIEKNLTGVDVIFLSLVSFLFVLLRFPSIFEPHWYGDEGVYEIIGIALNSGRTLYSGIWDNKPPLLYIIYAIFNGDLFSVRLASLIVGLVSTVVFFLIVKKLFKKYLSIVISTIFFVLGFGLPIIEGNIANAENFMVLPILIAFYLLFCFEAKKITAITVVAGILLSIAFLTKIVALFDLLAFSFLIFSLRFFANFSFNKVGLKKELIKVFAGFGQEVILCISFIAPVILTIIYFAYKGALFDFLKATFSQNVGYVGYGNYFLFPMGFLILKVVLLVSVILISFRFRRSLTRTGFIIIVWTAFALFDSLFSNRPYTHYLIMTLAPYSLLLGLIFESKKLAKIALPLAIIVFLIIDHYFGFYKKIIPYYQNYIVYMQGGSIEKYQRFFDNNTPRGYHLADFIKANTLKDENVFVWGDSPQIYVLSNKLPPGRYTVAYHITSYPGAISETQKALEKTNPRFIIQTKDNPAVSNFLDGYTFKYKVDNAVIYERQY